MGKTRKMIKADKKYQAELDFFSRVKAALNEGRTARTVECTDDEKELLDSAFLLTGKPVIYAANMSESDFKNGIENNKFLSAVKEIAAKEQSGVMPICAETEAEIADMPPEEKELFLSDMGLEQSGLDRLITACYSLLGLISFLTAGEPEVRAWTITKGTKAPQAAGKIHSDFIMRFACGGKRKGPRAQRGQRLRHAGRRRCPFPFQRLTAHRNSLMPIYFYVCGVCENFSYF